ncbi:MAG: hypothetical protein NVSMB27_31690 [Ktedonobacteraceae bacterium]
MPIYFLDTSAIVKRYIAEPGQAWVLSLYDSAQQHELYISQIALVEVAQTTGERVMNLPYLSRVLTCIPTHASPR